MQFNEVDMWFVRAAGDACRALARVGMKKRFLFFCGCHFFIIPIIFGCFFFLGEEHSLALPPSLSSCVMNMNTRSKNNKVSIALNPTRGSHPCWASGSSPPSPPIVRGEGNATNETTKINKKMADQSLSFYFSRSFLFVLYVQQCMQRSTRRLHAQHKLYAKG